MVQNKNTAVLMLLLILSSLSLALVAYVTLTPDTSVYTENPDWENTLPAQQREETPVANYDYSNTRAIDLTVTTAGGGSGTEQATFSILEFEFNYPIDSDAIWIDECCFENDSQIESYVYRYPFVPNDESWQILTKNPPGTYRLTVAIHKIPASTTLDEYVKNFGFRPEEIATVTTPHVVGYLASPLDSRSGQTFYFRLADRVISISNAHMISDNEFQDVIASIVLH